MKQAVIFFFISLLSISCMNTQNKQESGIRIADSTEHSLGEGALWDQENQRLFYIDIIGKKLFEYYPDSEKKITHEMPSMIGTVVVKNENEVLVALEDGIYTYNLHSKALDFLVCPPENDSTQRFNDGKCDPAGRFWVGTMSLVGGKETSHLFCLDQDGNMEVKLDGITTSNGIVWSSDKQYMYYIDTPTKKVLEFKYDNVSGQISNPRVAVQVADSLGSPDGMAIDEDNHLWVCMWGGSAVCCFDPASGELIDRIMVPAKNVTSCAFSGEELNNLYITTARIGTSKEDLIKYPNAGSLFKINLKKAGIASFCY
jgi:sugar lactone lactonase YvrE